jgi:protoporphyrinogen/coproporphyrinogen III oxidase
MNDASPLPADPGAVVDGVVDVVVIGGGISGLTAAFRLQQQGLTVEVLETGPRAGGVIGSRNRDGFLFETGPNSTLDTTPLISALLADLGIAGERRDASALAATRFIVRGGALLALPTSPPAFLGTRAFSLRAKLRLLREPFIAPTPAGVEESIAAFVRRRLGREFLDYAIDPFVSGIYAGDPERISVPAAFPRLHALEQKYGSLIKGQIAGARERKRNAEPAKNVAASFSFASGMQTLTDALARRVARVRTGARVARLARRDDGTYAVAGDAAGAPFARRARAVVLAVGAGAASELARALAPAAAEALAAIEYAPVAVAASAYRRADVAHTLAGFGFLVPKRERRSILGSLFSSTMFAGRAPEGAVLLTSFVGGRRNPELPAKPDAELARIVHAELAALVGATGTPLWTEITRWPRAIPQYDLGHLGRLAHVDAAESALPGLRFCASYRGGVAVGDCIKSAHATAEGVAGYLATARQCA